MSELTRVQCLSCGEPEWFITTPARYICNACAENNRI